MPSTFLQNWWEVIAKAALVFVALWATCAVLPAGAQVRTAFPTERGFRLSDFPRTLKLADNVYGYEDIRAPGFTTVSLFVVGREGVLIADGQESPAAQKRLLAAVAKVTDKPIKWYVVGSDHSDHMGGASVLPSGIRYVVSPASRAQLVKDAAQAQGKPDVFPVIVPPSAMQGMEENIDLGTTQVKVLNLGRAHTGGDLMVYLPAEKILFMSEVFLNRVFPALRSGYADEWAVTLDRALALDVKTYVPGHGFIEEPVASREQLVEFRDALVYVNKEVRRLRALGFTQEQARVQANWGPYATWMLADSQGAVAIKRIFESPDETPK